MVCFIGMGLLGSNFVKAMLNKGQLVAIWNRTYAKAKVLESFGAKVFADVTEAVREADRIHLTLPDDAVINEVLEKARPFLKPGCCIIDHSTTSTKGAEERTMYWKKLGFTYLHAPVFMGPQNALESTGFILVSGDQDVIRQWEPVLSEMTGKVLNFGTAMSRAAGVKLLGNSYLIFLSTGITESLSLAKAMGIPAADFSTLLNNWNPGASAPARLKRILAADYNNPTWELDMARKDTGLMLQEAALGNMEMFALPAIAAEMDKLIAQGWGEKDWTILAKDKLPS